MSKETITLNKGELEFIIAQALDYGWNEASRYKKGLKYPMESWDNKEKERMKIVDHYFNLKNQNKDEMDYNCDKCGTLGNFTDGTMWGIGINNIETCLCSYCLHKKISDTFIAANLGK